MHINTAALNLIKSFEGFRDRAYKCPAGIWTIGYGHTSEAGDPEVRAGDRITKARAEEILRADVGAFADGVSGLIRVSLNGNQFGALVSFAYNVGLGAFAKSGVLKAVNARQWDIVPRRLALWCKAGGRVLPGLVRRRADEGALFATADGMTLFDTSREVTGMLIADMDEARGQIDVPGGKAILASTTNWAAAIGAVSMIAGQVQEVTGTVTDTLSGLGFTAADLRWLLLGLGLAAALWIIRERWLKARADGV